jgi:hypothetical protein
MSNRNLPGGVKGGLTFTPGQYITYNCMTIARNRINAAELKLLANVKYSTVVAVAVAAKTE